MAGFAIALGLSVFALVAVAVIVRSIRTALPAVRALRSDLAACPDKLAVRFTLVETVCRWDDGTVVPLPVRPRLAPADGLRAAA